MQAYIVRRLLQAPIAILGVLVVVFLALASTGDPALLLAPPEATAEEVQGIRQAYGLDRPLVQQIVIFVFKAVQGDFGQSFFRGDSALSLVFMRFPATAQLGLAAILLAVVVGVPLGTIAALKRGTLIDQLVMILATVGQSLAHFWLGLMLIFLFAVRLGWVPVAGREGFSSIILPALALSSNLMALLARLTRSGIVEVLGEDYVRTAWAKGLRPGEVLTRHVFRNALIPLITITGLSIGWMLGGTVVIEVVFAWPGVGALLYSAVLSRDYPVVLAGVTYLAFIFIAINLVVDMLYAYADPRIRYS